jgi:hypothetical protein
LILKYEIVNNTSYVQDFQKLKNYNTTYHSTLQATPDEVWKGDKKHYQEKNVGEMNFLMIMKKHVVDKVEHTINKKGEIFHKSSSTSNYTKTIYKKQK